MRGIGVVGRIEATARAFGSAGAVAIGLAKRHRNYRRFIVVAPPRSGSTMLCRTLSKHPELISYEELFNESLIGWGPAYPSPLFRQAPLHQLRRQNPVDFLRRHVWCDQPLSIKAVGFKMLYNQILHSNNFDVAEYFSLDRSFEILHLTRRSLLRAYLSSVKTQRTGVSQKSAGQLDHADRPVTLDPHALVRYIVGMRRWHARIDTLFEGHDIYRLEYGHMVSNWTTVRADIFKHLGVSPIDVAPAVERLSTLSLRESIENYGFVADVLADFGFENEILDDCPV